MNDTNTITINRSIYAVNVNRFDDLNNKINKLTKDIDKLKRRSSMNFRKRNKRIKIKY